MVRGHGNSGIPHTGVHRLSRRFIEPAQDVLVLGLGIALLGVMLRTLISLFWELTLPVLEFRAVISGVLFVLVMIEVLRLLIVYLQEHRVAVDFMVELGIVATLREIVLLGYDWNPDGGNYHARHIAPGLNYRSGLTQGWAGYRQRAASCGAIVINATPGSCINEFRRAALADLLLKG